MGLAALSDYAKATCKDEALLPVVKGQSTSSSSTSMSPDQRNINLDVSGVSRQ